MTACGLVVPGRGVGEVGFELAGFDRLFGVSTGLGAAVGVVAVWELEVAADAEFVGWLGVRHRGGSDNKPGSGLQVECGVGVTDDLVPVVMDLVMMGVTERSEVPKL